MYHTKKLFNNSKIANRMWKLYKGEFPIEGEFLDTSIVLCDYCLTFGWCMKYNSDYSDNQEEILKFGIEDYSNNQEESLKFGIKDYLNLVPTIVECGQYGKYSKFHLQVACDAFHQEDYETAILNFRAALEVNTFYVAVIGVALAYFMVKDYDNAASFAQHYYAVYDNPVVENLIQDIVKASADTASKKEAMVVTETVTNSIETITTTKEFTLQHAYS